MSDSILPLVSEKIKEERLDICKACDKGENQPIGFICSECGCFLHLKTRWKNTKCPIGKW